MPEFQQNPAPNTPYYTPAQKPPAGTALDLITADGSKNDIPTLFTPLTLRRSSSSPGISTTDNSTAGSSEGRGGLTLQNRLVVSPMCTYSASQGHLTDWHLIHYGAFATRGAPLTIIEATGVLANGRISPECSGLWSDTHIPPLKRIADYIHSQGQKVGIQLAHAGRKASVLSGLGQGRPGTWSAVASEKEGGWPDDVWAPSAIPFPREGFVTPKEMTVEQIKEVVEGFRQASVRAVQAGMDLIEFHAAHGYLISEFLSPVSNKRTDQYGGSFENRIRLLREVITAVRGVIPDDMPLFVRVSATEWMEYSGEPSWDVEQTIRLAKMLPELGVDLLDVSSGGQNALQQIKIHPYYQLDIAGRIRDELRRENKWGNEKNKKMLVGGVGMVSSAEMARDVVQETYPENGQATNGETNGDAEGRTDGTGTKKGGAKADLVLAGRQFLREPEFVLKAAHELGVRVARGSQYAAAPFPRREREKKL